MRSGLSFAATPLMRTGGEVKLHGVDVGHGRTGAPATFRPWSSRQAICDPSGDQATLWAFPLAGRSQPLAKSSAPVPASPLYGTTETTFSGVPALW